MIQDICFELIQDPYYYGLFGDFILILDKNTGMFNATQLCQTFDKKVTDWLHDKNTKTLIQFYENKLEVPWMQEVPTHEDTPHLSGLYMRPEFLLSMLLWLSHDFYHKVNTITHHAFITQFHEKYHHNEKKLKKKLQKIEARKKRSVHKLLKKDPQQTGPAKLNVLAILQKNNEEVDYPYYVVRCQKAIYTKTIKDVKGRYPNMTLLYEIKYNPSIINLFSRIKETITYIDTKFNHLKLSRLEWKESFPEILIQDIEKLIPKF